MKTPEFIKKIDWSELRNQKRRLIVVIENLKINKIPLSDDLNGILHLIDALQDYAVDDAKIIDSIHVYDFELEEERETKIPTCENCWHKCKRNKMASNYMPCANCNNDLNEWTAIPKFVDRETPTKRTDYVCAHCNSNNVQVKAWMKPNDGNQIVDFVEDSEIGWCDDCQLSSIIETKDVDGFENVIGFQVVGENGTNEEGKTHPHMDSKISIYNITQVTSMLDDKNNGEKEWQLLAVWTNDIKNPFWMFDGDPRD